MTMDLSAPVANHVHVKVKVKAEEKGVAVVMGADKAQVAKQAEVLRRLSHR